MDLKRGQVFHTGEICVESGVYRLKNCKKCQTLEQHEIPLSKDKTFPPCRNCATGAVWEFVRRA